MKYSLQFKNMSIYIELLLLAAVIVFVVDLSGWTDWWLGRLSRFTTRRGYPAVKELRPFTCSLCLVWWGGIIYAIVRNNFTLPILAYVAGLAFLSITLRELFIFIRETLTNAIAKLNEWLND